MGGSGGGGVGDGGGGGGDGGGGDGGGDGGGGEGGKYSRGPQSAQSVPRSHWAPSAPACPSWQWLLLMYCGLLNQTNTGGANTGAGPASRSSRPAEAPLSCLGPNARLRQVFSQSIGGADGGEGGGDL